MAGLSGGRHVEWLLFFSSWCAWGICCGDMGDLKKTNIVV